jgi:hypothetical protein
VTRFRLSLILVIALTLLLGGVTAAGAHPPQVAPSEPGEQDDCSPFTEFNAENFNDSTDIDNTFLPLKPGTRRVYTGTANRTGEALEHTVTFTVTDVTKVIDGVPTIAVHDTDENAGELVEEELAFWAQDDEGNVWNLGEYPEEFENGEFTGAPNTWISGIEDAVGGIHMLAHPEIGDDYLQGSVPSIEFLDCAFVFEKGASVCVPFSCFDDVLVTHERSPLVEGGGIQTKAHAPGKGIVEIGAIDDPEGETLALTEFAELDEAELNEARDAVLRLDARGFENSEVYAQSEPAVDPRAGGDDGGEPGQGGEDPGQGGGEPDNGGEPDDGGTPDNSGKPDDDKGDDHGHDKGDDHGDKPKGDDDDNHHGDKPKGDDDDKDHGDKPKGDDDDDHHGDKPKGDDDDNGDDRHHGDEGENRHKGDDDRHKGDDDRHKGDDDRHEGRRGGGDHDDD